MSLKALQNVNCSKINEQRELVRKKVPRSRNFKRWFAKGQSCIGLEGASVQKPILHLDFSSRIDFEVPILNTCALYFISYSNDFCGSPSCLIFSLFVFTFFSLSFPLSYVVFTLHLL